MRKLLVAGLMFSVVFAACETKSPVGPAQNSPTTSTTSVSSTTTTSVVSSVVMRFGAFPPQASEPTDMTLFFKLITIAAPAGVGQLAAVTENQYAVTGVYAMGNGTTGTVEGVLGGSLNPIETGGTFTGSLTATTPAGCNAEREFSGILSGTALQWNGGEPGTSTCIPSPLGFSSMSMLRADAGAPLPTVPSSSSSSTTSSATTSSIKCDYGVFRTDEFGTFPPSGGEGGAGINTDEGCAWSSQSLVDWIIMRPPFGGTGSANVAFDVQPNNTGAFRTGELLIATVRMAIQQAADGTLVVYSVDRSTPAIAAQRTTPRP
jgi:hypothetical protein